MGLEIAARVVSRSSMTNEQDKAEVSDKIENGKGRVLQANSLVKSLLQQLKEKLSLIEELEAIITEQQTKIAQSSDEEVEGQPKLALDTLKNSKAMLNGGIQSIPRQNQATGDEIVIV